MSDYTKSNARLELMNRRTMLGGFAALSVARAACAAEASPIPASGSLGFRVVRNGDEIGKHVLTFRQEGELLRVDVVVDIVVTLGPIAVFRYVHRSSETLRGGLLIAAEGRTDDDGKQASMSARLGPGGLQVQGSTGGNYTAPAGAMMASHWNHRELDGPMINPQGGKLMRPVVTRYPEGQIALASGRNVAAKRFNLSGDAKLDLWYDRAETWTATRFVAEDGSEVLYQRV
jgi:hypothetical protein